MIYNMFFFLNLKHLQFHSCYLTADSSISNSKYESVQLITYLLGVYDIILKPKNERKQEMKE